MIGETWHYTGNLDGPARGRRAPVRRLAAAGACAALLVGLVVLVKTGGATPFDLAGDAAFTPLRTHTGLAIFLWITVMGTEACRCAILLAVTALLWSEGSTRVLRPLWLTVIGSEVTTWAVKILVNRPRPVFLPGVATAASPSFPSAHSAGTLALIGALALLVANRRVTGPQRALVGVVAAILIGTIGVSRLVLNVHFPTDVLSGFLVGGFWVLIGSLVWRSAPAPSRSGTQREDRLLGR